MKKLLLFLVLSIAGNTFCNAQSKLHLLTAEEKKNYILSVDQTEFRNLHYHILTPGSYSYDHKKYKFTSVPVKLTNNSDDTLKYIIMSCSADDSYHTNSKYIRVLESVCEYNVPVKKILPPHQSSTTDIRIRVIKTLNSSNNSFKISMNVCMSMGQNPTDFLPSNLFVDSNNIWSNEVKLPLSK